MQDLNVISRQNAEAAEQEGLNAARRAGRFVVAKYTGLHLVGFESFDHRDDAGDAAHAVPPSPDVYFKLLNPTGGIAGFVRDQSEDRRPEQTLGQYIERKSA